MAASSISVVPTGAKVCRPFLVEVMVFSPESGYKFKVIVERACTSDADAIWKLVFDLYKIAAGQETQVVHVSFTAGSPVEQQGVQLMASEGVKPAQAAVLVNEVHPAAKDIEGVTTPTKKQKQRLHDSMAKAVVASADV
jgi:hypothetical protein